MVGVEDACCIALGSRHRARVVEQRSELVKHHLWVLWTDYFKPNHFEAYPDLHTLFNTATGLGLVDRDPTFQAAAALDDKIWRALGTLKNARAISGDEALFLLSHLRMGVVLERIKDTTALPLAHLARARD